VSPCIGQSAAAPCFLRRNEVMVEVDPESL